ncbi:hypothetical protein [Chlamydia sp.]|uniref:hypothetical protein n=1 Tax=Chlamydia sp. TaxID=35827 RepID=UPI0025BF2111|nr:hypothetical protein [Chlamydia sp.]MBQ8498635.1 hypothetical protein [Chlamydia sp.]
MSRILILFLNISGLLSGCSEPPRSSHIEAARITTQSSGSLILYPSVETQSVPTYDWPTPKSPVITDYSFHCHGTSSSLDTKETLIFDCNGIKHLAKPFSIHPLLVAIVQHIHHQIPVTIEEGYCCPMHHRFLQASGSAVSNKHCQGKAAIISTQHPISSQMLAPILAKLYKGPPLPSKTLILSENTIENEDFIITFSFRNNKPALIIEILDE